MSSTTDVTVIVPKTLTVLDVGRLVRWTNLKTYQPAVAVTKLSARSRQIDTIRR